MKVVIQLLVWNGKKYLPYLFDSLLKQTCKDWHLLIMDNASTDGSAQWLAEHLPAYRMPYTLVTNSQNLGFAGGHNMLCARVRNEFPDAKYVLLLNQDMYLDQHCIERLVAFADAYPSAGAVGPRIMRWDFARAPKDDAKYSLGDSKTSQIDTLGLKVFSNRRCVDWFAGRTYSEEMLAPYVKRRRDGAIEVFGISGALPLYRMSALSQAWCDGWLFDPDYGSYKEDVDLAWRLRRAGSSAFTVLGAVAYHDRTAAGARDMSDRATLEFYRFKPEYVRFQSYRNHLLTLFKNESWQNCIIDAPHIIWYELKKFIYLCVRYPHIAARAWADIIRFLPRMYRRRRQIVRTARASWVELRKWWDDPIG